MNCILRYIKPYHTFLRLPFLHTYTRVANYMSTYSTYIHIRLSSNSCIHADSDSLTFTTYYQSDHLYYGFVVNCPLDGIVCLLVDEYSYEWSLISSAVDDQLGKMSGIDTATCQLTEVGTMRENTGHMLTLFYLVLLGFLSFI